MGTMTALVLGLLAGSISSTYDLDLAMIQDAILPVAFPIVSLHFR
jgi:hypothetical protein